MTELTTAQKARIHCIKNGHGKYITNCMGYVHCGRCEEQIGDTLMGTFNASEYALVGHKCRICTEAYGKLSDIDQLIFKRLEKGLNQADALKGIDFE